MTYSQLEKCGPQKSLNAIRINVLWDCCSDGYKECEDWIPGRLVGAGAPFSGWRLTCEGIPRLDAERNSSLTFAGGFDPREVALYHKNDTTFLALAYPTAEEYQELLQRIGTVDLKEQDVLPGIEALRAE